MGINTSWYGERVKVMYFIYCLTNTTEVYKAVGKQIYYVCTFKNPGDATEYIKWKNLSGLPF